MNCTGTFTFGQSAVYMLFVCAFFSGAMAVKGGVYDPGTEPILMDQVNCIGNESSLVECEYLGVGEVDCYHHEDAGVNCSGKSVN